MKGNVYKVAQSPDLITVGSYELGDEAMFKVCLYIDNKDGTSTVHVGTCVQCSN